MISGIYSIHNTVTGKRYIGLSVDVEKRMAQHRYALRRSVHYNEHLQRSFNLYGENSFDFRVLERVSAEMLEIRERAWIEYYHSNVDSSGYNGDSGGRSGRRCSVETRRKMSIARMGNKYALGSRQSLETRRLKSESLKGVPHLAARGRPLSEDHRRKISLGLMGRVCSPETRMKISMSERGKTVSEETRLRISNVWRAKRKS